MSQQNVMIDLETFSTHNNAVILSIGAVKFDQESIHGELKINIDPKSCVRHGLHIEKDTVDWWKQQSPEAIASWKSDPQQLPDALNQFNEWYGTDKKRYWVWGHGAIFDIMIMESAYRAAGIAIPWAYPMIMCLRTVVNLTGQKVPRLEGTHHNALDDARNQARYLQRFMKGEPF